MIDKGVRLVLKFTLMLMDIHLRRISFVLQRVHAPISKLSTLMPSFNTSFIPSGDWIGSLEDVDLQKYANCD